ncbi:MAG: DUF3131 domain-containing protein [Clostridia bacterium]|nr:DUF3131 domain-containing protein [Clostridia bacterium]
MRPTTWEYQSWDRREAPLDDRAMQQHVRALAVSMNAPRRAPLCVCPEEAFRTALETARALAGETETLAAPLQWLCENGRPAEALFAALAPRRREARRFSLPALPDGKPRVQAALEETVKHGDAPLTEKRLTDCLCAFDEVRALEMAELWAVPAALACALKWAFAAAARRAAAAQRERIAAEKWAASGAVIGPARRGGAFLEHALQKLHERDDATRRAELEKWLADHDCPAEQVIATEHERQALERLQLDHMLAALRLLNGLDWSACFARVSRVERTLMKDPAGTYPRMENDSRDLARGRIADLAARCDVGEATFAAAALRAAERSEGIRREVCWWLMTDEGTRALLDGMGVKARGVPKIHPDPGARAYRAGALLLAAAVMGPLAARHGWLALAALPAALCAAEQAMNRALARVKPRRLLKLELDPLPDDCRTAVVMPALLSSPEQAAELAFQLETLGCLEKDPGFTFILLGDLPDADQAVMPEDEAILAAAREAIDGANRRADRPDKYILLTRKREYARCMRRCIAPERKRGALNALAALLTGGGNPFDQPEAEALAGRGFAFFITLDAGTKMLPGTSARLVGALAHPLNRARYAMLAPRMTLPAEAVTNRFVRLLGGEGGLDAYPTAVSDIWQDLAGEGNFGGKGIVDIAAFRRAMEEARLPEGQILSHDLLEGLIAKAGFIDDVTLFEGHPRRAQAWFARLHRWTRGDWQLVGFLFREGFSGLDRWKIGGNLFRSLAPASAFLSLALGFFTGRGLLIAAGLISAALPLLLRPTLKKEDWERLLLRFSLLPHEAWVTADAALRALFRLLVTKRRLLEWVTADDAERRGGALSPWPSRMGALILLASIPFQPTLVLPAALIAALWASAPARVRELEAPEEKESFDEAQRALMTGLAKRTWRFFAENTLQSGLTPDNVQLDPPRGAALRTSPTNIGLYMTGCAAACLLGLIDAAERDERLRRTAETLERLEKWRGHLYNWYDIAAERPLSPRYVSSVDSGNLAASLLLSARVTDDRALGARLEALARGMDFTALYDARRKLFHVGMDMENGRLSESHYDLLASESRILSFTAMALGQVPCAHYARLGRACARVDGGAALISWSGTLFEYLMPCIFLPSWEDTLIGRSNRRVVSAQQARAGEGFPWGVSESGYYAFDLQMNYQYRAFGLSEAALRGERQESVVSPYASALALSVDGQAALVNLQRMLDMGWADEQGFFEAADFDPARIPDGAPYRLVKSHMAHHQGMILAALCNALTGDALVKLFCSRTEAAALTLLLQERGEPKATFAPRRERREAPRRAPQPQGRDARLAECDAHPLCGAGMLLACVPQGALFARGKDGILVNPRPWRADEPFDGLSVHVRADGEDMALTGCEAQAGWTRAVRFEPGRAVYSLESGRAELRCILCVSPEDGAILQRVTLENKSDRPIDMAVTSCFRVALAREADYEAHPAFHELFIESESPEPGALIFRRRPRSRGERWPALIHMLQEARNAEITWETDLNALIPRGRRLNEGGALADRLACGLGHALQPCSALRCAFRLNPGEKREAGFAIGLVDRDERAFMTRRAALSGDRRAEELAETQSRELTRYLALEPAEASLIDRAAALLLLPLPGPERETAVPPDRDLPARLLWPLGVSGERAMMTVRCRGVEGMPLIRAAARAHEYYRSRGMLCELLFINDSAGGYDQPLRERLASLSGGEGVHVVDGETLTKEQRALLRAASALWLDSAAGGFRAQVKAILASRRRARPALPPVKAAANRRDTTLAGFNGWGGFSGDRYVIEYTDTPAPWCNILCNRNFGSMVSERGDSFTWLGNSRSGRLTPFDNDPHGGSRGERLRVTCAGEARDVEGAASRATHAQGESVYEGTLESLAWTSHVFVDCELPVKCHCLTLKNEGGAALNVRLDAEIEWIMGVSRRDARFARTCARGGLLFARGQIGGAAFMALTGAEARAHEGGLTGQIALEAGEKRTVGLLLGCGDTPEEIEALVSGWQGEARLRRTLEYWRERLSRAEILTPDALLNAQLNRFLPYQVICARLYGRAGWYQPGGAYGFRDQLQDTLSLLFTAPEEAREHILRCAAHQFESGDVQHWWHGERTGVRTRISDDMLFLPYVTGCYVAETGDGEILNENVPFLKDVAIPDGRGDWYGEAEVSESRATLREHCLRAIDRASRAGAHGLLLMGAGDWNDGMNRVGARGRGESVWLTEFMIATIRRYSPCCSEEESARLRALAGGLAEALEREAWDGRWYLRAFDDEGAPLGGHENAECRIDSLPQSWAVLAGLDGARCEQAMDAVGEQLTDREHGLIRLLTPPFDGERDAGYIGGYPPGIRENGGQYTHAACWVVLALAALGRADEAWETFQTLLLASHGDTREKEKVYCVEPYVMAGDIYDGAHAGRGGWTWYTGAAGWMLRAAWTGLLGVEKRGDTVRMNALLPKGWREVSAMLRVGGARYTLTSSRDCAMACLDGMPCPDGVVRLVDDGRAHRALFPARGAQRDENGAEG